MSLSSVRCASLAAALLAVTACSGGSTFSPGSNGGTAAEQALRRGAAAFDVSRSFVHAGVPFVRPQDAFPALSLPAMSPDYKTGKTLLFEGDSTNQDVQIYEAGSIQKNKAPIATITSGIYCPYGSALDSKGTLYVANNCGRNTITEYPKGKTTQSTEITNGVENPLGIAIDSKGTLYVANYPASINEYPAGATSPSQTITSPDLKDPFGLALDAHDNLYIADFGTGGVYELPYGSTTIQAVGLTDLTEPLNLAFDKAGNLWVTDGEGDKVNVYPPGSTSPSESITSGYSFPYQVAADPLDIVTSNQSSSPEVYGYKSGKYTPYATLTNDIKLTTGLLLATP